MARNKKTSPAEDIVEIVAALPWWLGLVLAVIFYVVLHSMAEGPVAITAGSPEQIGQLMVGTMKKTLAGFGQYLLPFLCLVGTAISVGRRGTRKQLIDSVVAGTGADGLKAMSWQQFELAVGEAFRLQGYSVIENGGGGADGGVDLVLRKGGEKFLVQCKQWRAFKVGVTVIRELYGVMAADGAVGGFVVTCGQFTKEAETFAKGRNITLVDGGKLETMIRRTRPGPVPSSASAPASAPAAANSQLVVPNCPVCGKSMLTRTAQRGANAGKKFWGCAAYPSCRGIVSIN
jgi:restriction system protein